MRQLRNYAGVHLVRGAATAIGSAVVTCELVWIQTRPGNGSSKGAQGAHFGQRHASAHRYVRRSVRLLRTAAVHCGHAAEAAGEATGDAQSTN